MQGAGGPAAGRPGAAGAGGRSPPKPSGGRFGLRPAGTLQRPKKASPRSCGGKSILQGSVQNCHQSAQQGASRHLQRGMPQQLL